MKLGDLLLKHRYITKKQLNKALREQSIQAIQYDKSVQIGKILIDNGYVGVDEITEALNEQQQEKKEDKVMPTEIGEGSQFTFDLKFIATMGAILVSACGVYFSITGQLNELEANNSPNRLEHEYVVKEVENIKSMGDLKIISYKLDEYDETFKDLKTLSTTLSPLAADLTYIKGELEKLRNKKVDIPEVDLSGIDDCKDKLDALHEKIETFEERISKLEKRNSKGSRF
tara:strand:+ start:88 stop:774 length:687 start_codon:yes stop_codon:yes gene_type:complete